MRFVPPPDPTVRDRLFTSIFSVSRREVGVSVFDVFSEPPGAGGRVRGATERRDPRPPRPAGFQRRRVTAANRRPIAVADPAFGLAAQNSGPGGRYTPRRRSRKTMGLGSTGSPSSESLLRFRENGSFRAYDAHPLQRPPPTTGRRCSGVSVRFAGLAGTRVGRNRNEYGRRHRGNRVACMQRAAVRCM